MSDQEFDELDKKLAEAQAAQAARAEQPKPRKTAGQKESGKRTTDERHKRSDHHEAQEDASDRDATTQWNKASQEEPLYTRRRPTEPGRGRGRGWLKVTLWMTAGAAALLLAVGSVLLVKKATASPEEAPQRVVDTRMTFSDFILAQAPPDEPEVELPLRPRNDRLKADKGRGAAKSVSLIRQIAHIIFGD
jgi:hypothetical protein